MKKRLTTALLAGAMAASMVMPAMADPGDLGVGAVPAADGTEVWAGVVIDDPDAKIKVEVPTLFAFVVKGSTTAVGSGVGVTAGELYLPNVKVNVTTPSDSNGENAVYEVSTVGTVTEEGKLPFTNYSTASDGTGRIGLAVKINGNIKNEGDAASRKYWTHTTSGGTTTATTDFKHYNVKLDGHEFDTLAANGGLQLANDDALTLAAPDVDLGGTQANVDSVTKYATTGETTYAAFDVSVGGEIDQYNQVEQSAKIGTIVWTVSAEISGDVVTAPDAPYLDGQ